MCRKTFFILVVISLVLPVFVLADAPPPPPFTVNFTYESQKIIDEKFYAAVLECEDKDTPDVSVIPQLNVIQPNTEGNCNWLPHLLPYTDYCVDSQCKFNWVLGDFKLAAYIPSLDKTFVSDVITREYVGYYGRKTQTVYDVNLLKDSSVVVNNVTFNDLGSSSYGSLAAMAISLVVTVILESLVVLIFFLLKKVPKRIFPALLLGNLISVPFVWLAASAYLTDMVYVLEIAAVVFEAWLIRIFSKKTVSWKMSLLISLLMNIVSFFVGSYFLYLYFGHLLR